jgi:hypothetical protein
MYEGLTSSILNKAIWSEASLSVVSGFIENDSGTTPQNASVYHAPETAYGSTQEEEKTKKQSLLNPWQAVWEHKPVPPPPVAG